MTEVKKVKIQNFIETQIPEFLNVDNPLFKEFLSQYYASVEHQTGVVDLSSNLNYYKSIENFNYETFYAQLSPQVLTQDVEPFHNEINVNNTIGFPDKYGLLKINNEIITYTSKTETKFEGCIRGFSGIENINSSNNFNFSITEADFHQVGSQVQNLNLNFFNEIFKKFRYQFLPGFENRNFTPNINFKTILSRARDFYITKGTDTSYKLLFKVLFNEEVEILKPQEYMLRPSDNTFFVTKNILVEKVLGEIDPLDLKGYTLYQNTENGIANAVIYNIEVRPVENNKILYEISLDPSSIQLDFISTKKSNVIESVDVGSNIITVDSTIGFSTTSLLVDSINSPSPFFISYEEKTINQFLNTSGVLVNLEVNDSIIENNFAYVDDGEISAQFRILNIIDSVNYSNTFGMKVGDIIKLSTFGENLNDNSYFNKWIYNIPTKHKIKSITSTSQLNRKKIELFDDVNFTKGEQVLLYNTNAIDIIEKEGVVVVIDGTNFIEIESTENISNIDTISKKLRKSNVLNYPQVNNLVSNIQNTYIDSNNEHLYVASSGLPDYQILADNRKILLSTPNNPNPTSGIAYTTILTTNKTHKYYTGEKIWITESNNLGIETGTYFITTLGTYADSDKISLSYSNSDVFSNKYINVSYGATGEFVKLDYQYKTLEHQKLLKKFKLSNIDTITNTIGDKSTNNKPIGMLLNGVEMYSSTLYDENIYYGKLENIEVTNVGSGYDVVNIPDIIINDTINGIQYGVGAKAHLVLSGSVSSVKIVNPGSGYSNDIKVSITGGNGYGALLEPIIIKDRIQSGFRGDGTGVNPTDNSIIFTLPHNFEDGEIIEYDANSNPEIEYSDPIISLINGIETIIGGQIRKLSDNSFYFAGVITDHIIKLYRTKEDAANKVNEINLTTSPSSGFHYFKSIESKNKLTGISVKESGFDYSNKRVFIPSVDENYGEQNGISITEDYIFAKGHSFKDKDLVIYETTEVEIAGLSTSSKYYVKTIDKDKFRLSLAGIGNSISDSNYNSEKYIKFSSVGVGTHKFSYPPIEIQIEASLESSNGKLVLPVLEPIVLGNIENVFLENGGEKYGTYNVINYHRRPNINVRNITSEAILKPIILDGKIIDIQILNYGSGYGKDIDLIIDGTGNFADIYPIVQNGRIISVNIINGGIGYGTNTTISVKPRGTDAKFLANVFQWKINQIEKNKYLLENDDEGILVPSKNQQDGLQFVHFYPPKVFRYTLNDNLNINKTEISNPNISPILGWAYDGFPIYGPYQSLNGSIQRVKSSYIQNVELNSNLRPTGSMFPNGFFIQDYKYDSLVGDLDEYNGKFVINDDFPEGTYAYFFTIDVDVNNKSIPQYPYVVSTEFKSHYNKENYEPSHNQNLDFDSLNIIRNTYPYYLNSENSEYNFIDKVLDKYKQEFIVKSISSSGVDDISVYQPGDGYKVGDVVNLSGDVGSGAYASVFELEGRDINYFEVGVSTSYPVKFSKYGNRIVGTYTTEHYIKNNGDIVISNISDPKYKFLEGLKTVTVENKTIGISTDILDIGITGNITIIYPNDTLGFYIDDLILIDWELFKIIEVLPEVSALKVTRLSNSGVHTAGVSKVKILPRRFTFFDSNSKSVLIENKKRYFTPADVISVGSSSKQYIKLNSDVINISQKSIYLPNHNYFTGQPLTYNVGAGGTGIYVSNDGSSSFQLVDNQTVYAVNLGVDFLGISTVGFNTSIGIGNSSYSVFFNNPVIGIGELHSLRTQYYEVDGKVENHYITINTKIPHKLESGNVVTLNITPNISKSIKFRFDSQIRKITTDLISFDASSIDVNKSEIEINNLDLKTGDKIVYYSSGNTTIGGLSDNFTYFIINTSPGKIQLANYYTDALSGNNIPLLSVGSGTQHIAKINPKIRITYGNSLSFDLTDSSLVDTQLKLYKDSSFNIELETYNYVNSSGDRVLNTTSNVYPREIYYKFSKLNQDIYPDYEVKDSNLIEIESSDYNGSFDISVLDDTTFKVNLKGKPEDLGYDTTTVLSLNYSTKSKSVDGPIKKIKLNSPGKGYKKLPIVKKITSISGKNAILQSKSKNIGRISSLERIKDGFDYPTDITLRPVLSVPAIVQVEGISRIDYVGIITGGINYNTKPTLKVLGNDDIILDPILEGSSIVGVNVVKNTNNLTKPLRIIPTRNSNGYSINEITVNGTDVTLELLNSDNQIYPLITTGYGTTEVIFPFAEGDEIFIERCRIDTTETDGSGNIVIKNNYNSSDYDYQYFTVTGVSTENYTITYSVDGITNNLGNYIPDFGYGYVINRKDMAEFEMFISNDLEYLSEEIVLGYKATGGTNTFSAKVMKDGWNNDINELRLIDVKGTLNNGDKVVGQKSRLEGIVTDVNIFNLKTNLGVSREKINDSGDRVGYLNDFQQRISDNNYYQKFSYSIKGKIPYNIWKEPIKSTIHPSGFKEFSDLMIVGMSTASMKVGTASSLDLTINIDSVKSLYTKNNFAMVTEEDQFEDGSIERIAFEEGVSLKPYILSKSNKVTLIDDISSQFTGTTNLEIIANKDVTFISTDLYRLGVSTSGLNVGDKIGYSTYHFYPDSTYILSIGENYVGISTYTPHRLYSINGVSTSIVQNLDFYRRIPGDVIVGISSFKLTNSGYPLFYREFDASNGITTVVNISNDSFTIPNHNFHTGQKIIYTPEYSPYSAIASTTIGSGALLEPVFTGIGNSVSKIKVINGGSGYDSVNKPTIEIIGTKTPLSIGTFIPLIESVSGIITSIEIVDPGYGYFLDSLGEIGIDTTSESEGRRDILMAVGGGIGSAIYENGYNVAISTTISGISSAIVPNFSGYQNRFWGFGEPYIPVKSTSGSGIDAKFSVFIVYNSTTGNPISTSIILRDGGRNYSIGDSISIAGTYMGGSTPENDLSFTVSKVSSTRISAEANNIYTNINADSVVGYGTGAILNISRDSIGDIDDVEIVFGGINYELTDNISIAGTYIGGSTPGDNLYLSPVVLGTDKLPRTLYIEKIDDFNFKVAGLSTGNVLSLTELGIGTHSFSIENPNVNSIITIDNIIQSPVHKKSLELSLGSEIKYNDTTIYVNSGISSIVLNDILLVNNEYMLVKNVGVVSTNDIVVERAILGTIKDVHDINSIVYYSSGNYNIVKDNIHFSSPPYGPTGLEGLKISSSFSGRVFSRRSDPFIDNDENVIFDDISDQFTGIAATEFILKSNGSNVVGIFTNTNSVSGSSGNIDINNNPIILINNIPQIGGTDYIIDTPGQNTIKFISGVPLAGKITKVGVTTGYGYLPLVGASATVSISAAGTISNIYLTGFGQGYRTPPVISIASTVGSGASITSSIGTGGTVTSLSIVNAGSGYTSSILPEVRIDLPQNYYNMPLEYVSGYSGIGTGAKMSVVVGNGSSIISYNLDDSGTAYKVGDVLTISGIATDLNSPSFEEFNVTVLETYTDSFSGWYPGQFIQFDDISQYFNGSKRRFTLTITVNGQKQVLSLKSVEGLSMTNNLFVFVNDILQVPNESYTFTGTRIIFKEAPKKDSKCNILFFKGSDLDVEQIEPILTIKEGDIVQIDENINNLFDRPQFERVVKDIFATDLLDTFTYDSLGISTDPTKIRPLNWTKQTQDKVINGVLYPKSRPSLKSKIIPSSKIIKDISKVDQKIYVDSAIPLFSDLDEVRGISEDLRDVVILNNREIISPKITSVVSSAGTISSLDIVDPGLGFVNVNTPVVSISSRFITRKDPLYEWSVNVGIGTTVTFNSIGYGTAYISVGDNGLNAVSYDGKSWASGIETFSGHNINDVIGYNNTYIAVGDIGSVYKTNGISTVSVWQPLSLLSATQDILGKLTTEVSDYSGNFNKVEYIQNKDILVAVGSSGGLFNSSGINTSFLYENLILSFDFNSISYNEELIVVVGNVGSILYSETGQVWNTITSKATLQNLYDIIWDGSKFIAVGNNSTIITSTNGINWSLISTIGLNTNISKINYNNSLYTAIDFSGNLYFSLNLQDWVPRNFVGTGAIKNIFSTGVEDSEQYISIGSSGSIFYSTPVVNKATAISTTSNGSLSALTITNGGFGYSTVTTTPVIVETDSSETEKLYSIKAKGDYGTITNIQVFDTGNVGFGTTSPAILFTLKSDNYPISLPTMEYTPLEIGDYFIISNSNVTCGHALTGITTSLGGMSNYPLSKVGTTTSFIDGIYIVEGITESSLGISTIRCHFAPIPAIGADKIQVNIGVNTTGFYGNYSFGVIYDYQNRARETPISFVVNKDEGLVGLNTGPMIYRTRGII